MQLQSLTNRDLSGVVSYKKTKQKKQKQKTIWFIPRTCKIDQGREVFHSDFLEKNSPTFI